jgi:hypothetical protein
VEASNEFSTLISSKKFPTQAGLNGHDAAGIVTKMARKREDVIVISRAIKMASFPAPTHLKLGPAQIHHAGANGRVLEQLVRHAESLSINRFTGCIDTANQMTEVCV